MENTLRVVVTVVRKCGKRKQGKLYLVGGEEGSENGTLDRFTRMRPPVPYQVKLHRTPRIVDAHAILARSQLDEWWAGSSKDTEVRKSGEAWSLDNFGMTEHKRLSSGECTSAKTVDEALAILAGKIKWNNRIIDIFKDITIRDIHLNQRVSQHYEMFHQCILEYTKTHRIGDLMGAQAAVWRMALNLPPAKRNEFIPALMRILALMNLPLDASAMKKSFGV